MCLRMPTPFLFSALWSHQLPWLEIEFYIFFHGKKLKKKKIVRFSAWSIWRGMLHIYIEKLCEYDLKRFYFKPECMNSKSIKDREDHGRRLRFGKKFTTYIKCVKTTHVFPLISTYSYVRCKTAHRDVSKKSRNDLDILSVFNQHTRFWIG